MRIIYTIINDSIRIGYNIYETTGPLARKRRKQFVNRLLDLNYVYKKNPKEFLENLNIISNKFLESNETELVVRTSEDEKSFILLVKESSPYFNLRMLSILSWDDYLEKVTPEQTKMLYNCIIHTLESKIKHSYIV